MPGLLTVAESPSSGWASLNVSIITYSASIGCAIASCSTKTDVLGSFFKSSGAILWMIATNLSQNVPVGHFVNFSEHKTCTRKLHASVNIYIYINIVLRLSLRNLSQTSHGRGEESLNNNVQTNSTIRVR